MRLAFVRPVGDLIAIDPNTDVRPDGDNRFGEPLHVLGVDAPRILTPKDPPSAAIDRFGRVAIMDLILNLALIAIGQIARDTAKEDPRIESFGVSPATGLQNKIAQQLLTFQLPAPRDHFQFTCFGDFE